MKQLWSALVRIESVTVGLIATLCLAACNDGATSPAGPELVSTWGVVEVDGRNMTAATLQVRNSATEPTLVLECLEEGVVDASPIQLSIENSEGWALAGAKDFEVGQDWRSSIFFRSGRARLWADNWEATQGLIGALWGASSGGASLSITSPSDGESVDERVLNFSVDGSAADALVEFLTACSLASFALESSGFWQLNPALHNRVMASSVDESVVPTEESEAPIRYMECSAQCGGADRGFASAGCPGYFIRTDGRNLDVLTFGDVQQSWFFHNVCSAGARNCDWFTVLTQSSWGNLCRSGVRCDVTEDEYRLRLPVMYDSGAAEEVHHLTINRSTREFAVVGINMETSPRFGACHPITPRPRL